MYCVKESQDQWQLADDDDGQSLQCFIDMVWLQLVSQLVKFSRWERSFDVLFMLLWTVTFSNYSSTCNSNVHLTHFRLARAVSFVSSYSTVSAFCSVGNFKPKKSDRWWVTADHLIDSFNSYPALPARRYASAVFAAIVHPSVCHTRYCNKTAKHRIMQTMPYNSPGTCHIRWTCRHQIWHMGWP